MQPGNHVDDELLSAVVDGQFPEFDLSQVQGHLADCEICRERLEGLRSVATLLRALPEVDPPRGFALGLRSVGVGSNVVRLRRWYTATRIAAASLAAAFVVLSAGALYVDTRPAPLVSEAARPQLAAAPVSSPVATLVTARAGAAPAAAVRSLPQQQPQPDDQVAATTSVRPLPTPVPTPTFVPVAAIAQTVQAQDAGAPWRVSAVAVGLLAVLTLLGALVLRRRITTPSEY